MVKLTAPRTALPKAALPIVRLPREGCTYRLPRMPKALRSALVCWYDPKLQGCTNGRMAANPILKDLSGNGNDMQCNNFAWNEESGISADGSLRFDGVDDEGICYEHFVLTDFTVVCDKVNSDVIGGNQAVIAAKTVDFSHGAFVFETNHNNVLPSCMTFRGDWADCERLMYDGVTVLTPNKYFRIENISDYIEIPRGTAPDSLNSLLCIGTCRENYVAGRSDFDLRTFLLFNRSLTDSEVEWIKDNIIRPLPMHEALMRSCVAWYSPKKQGATNLSMAQNPTLYDFSGKGIDLKCYNFAWNTESGIDANGAIHFDGVTSYCKQIDGRKKMSDGFTVIYKRAIRETDSQYNWLFSDNSVSRSKNVLTCSPKALEEISDYVSFGYNNTDLPKVPTGTGVEYMQPTKFVDIDGNTFNIRKGSYNDDNVSPFIFGRNRDYGSGIDNFYTEYSLFDFILFDRVLSDVEIQYVKDNMISK